MVLLFPCCQFVFIAEANNSKFNEWWRKMAITTLNAALLCENYVCSICVFHALWIPIVIRLGSLFVLRYCTIRWCEWVCVALKFLRALCRNFENIFKIIGTRDQISLKFRFEKSSGREGEWYGCHGRGGPIETWPLPFDDAGEFFEWD